jgi:hypothetical protein
MDFERSLGSIYFQGAHSFNFDLFLPFPLDCNDALNICHSGVVLIAFG